MISCGHGPEHATTDLPTTDTIATAPQPPPPAEHQNAELTFQVIDAPNNTFGYEILSNGATYVRQTNIPGQPGHEGCRRREDAEKLAAFVIEKIRAGVSPPTVTSEELRTLGLID